MSNENEKVCMYALGTLDYGTAVTIGSYIGELKNKVEQYEKSLKAIKDIGDYYTEKGWALNPDKIEKIIDKALEV